MRRVALVLMVFVVACGGGAGESSDAKTAHAKDDRDFAAYAATHGIQTLEGGGEAAEVTADGLRFEAVQKERPVKLDGVINEWPALTKALVVAKGATRATLKLSLQYDETKLYVGADVTDASFQPGKDHVSLVFAVPNPGGSYTSYDLGFYAGKPGETEGTVRYGSRGNVGGARIVEAHFGLCASIEREAHRAVFEVFDEKGLAVGAIQQTIKQRVARGAFGLAEFQHGVPVGCHPAENQEPLGDITHRIPVQDAI